MNKMISATIVIIVMSILCSCSRSIATQKTIETVPSQKDSTTQSTSAIFAYDSINKYVTYTLPSTLVDGDYNRELGYLGGNLFRLGETGSSVSKQASEGIPPGWNSYGGFEMYNQLTCQFNGGRLIEVALPWNHSIYLSKPEPVDNCAAPAVIVKVSFDLYTAPEIDENHIPKDNQTSTMWYVFFAKEDSKIAYAVFLNAENYRKEEAISLAQSVRFSNNAFILSIQ
ncbi:MAG: hypothetical protein EOM76_08245 [Sphingobacteriia bacterium]|nr:hypothetical protein [Sphingobacteriia bacterium]